MRVNDVWKCVRMLRPFVRVCMHISDERKFQISWWYMLLLMSHSTFINHIDLILHPFNEKNWFFWTISKWFSVPFQFQTRHKKHAILIKNKHVRSPRVQKFWWYSPNRDVRPDEFPLPEWKLKEKQKITFSLFPIDSVY